MKEILAYIKNPCYCENRPLKLVLFLKLWGVIVLSVIPLAPLMFLVCHFFGLSHRPLPQGYSVWGKIFFVFVMAPVIEELLFRSWLKFKKQNILIFISVLVAQIVLSVIKSKPGGVFIYSAILLFFVTLLLLFKQNRIADFISSHFSYFFYASVFLFGFIHAFNFTGNIYAIVGFSFILGSPQIVGGAILGYIRMNHGLVYSILFHMAINSIILLSLLRH